MRASRLYGRFSSTFWVRKQIWKQKNNWVCSMLETLAVRSLQEQKHRPTPTSAATANIKAQVSVYLIICSANSSVEWTTTPLKNNILRDFDFLPCECGNVNFFFFLVLLEQWSVWRSSAIRVSGLHLKWWASVGRAERPFAFLSVTKCQDEIN